MVVVVVVVAVVGAEVVLVLETMHAFIICKHSFLVMHTDRHTLSCFSECAILMNWQLYICFNFCLDVSDIEQHMPGFLAVFSSS